MAERENRTLSKFDASEGLLLIAGFLSVSAIFLVLIVVVSKLDISIALPTLSIFGIVLLLFCLAAIAYVFVRSGLDDPKQALGLPSGSIQAVIALSLIVLFAILSVFIFTSMGKSSLRTIANLNESDRKEQVEKLSTTFAGWEKASDGTYTIYLRDADLDARNDIGKQLIVLIGTLMTSAVSFYFGTRATAAGIEKGADASSGSSGPPGADLAASIESVTPEGDVRIGTSTKVTITGSGLKDATEVRFRQAGMADGETFIGDISNADRSDSSLVCTVEPEVAGNYDCIVLVGGKTVTGGKPLTVLAAAGL